MEEVQLLIVYPCVGCRKLKYTCVISFGFNWKKNTFSNLHWILFSFNWVWNWIFKDGWQRYTTTYIGVNKPFFYQWLSRCNAFYIYFCLVYSRSNISSLGRLRGLLNANSTRRTAIPSKYKICHLFSGRGLEFLLKFQYINNIFST